MQLTAVTIAKAEETRRRKLVPTVGTCVMRKTTPIRTYILFYFEIDFLEARDRQKQL